LTTTTQRVLLRSDEIGRIVARLARQILEPDDVQQGLVLLGVRRGGEALAIRIAGEIERIGGRAPLLGFLNIDLYRDDRVTHA
jgi:pyrimidine operon attenuation protein/uracil phosphoribosyltransferase